MEQGQAQLARIAASYHNALHTKPGRGTPHRGPLNPNSVGVDAGQQAPETKHRAIKAALQGRTLTPKAAQAYLRGHCCHPRGTKSQTQKLRAA